MARPFSDIVSCAGADGVWDLRDSLLFSTLPPAYNENGNSMEIMQKHTTALIYN